MDMRNKVVVITGAKGGLGNFVTQAFLDAGASVVGVSRSIRDSDFAHPSFAAVPAELSSGEAARALVQTVMDRSRRMDAVIHLMGAFAGGLPVADTEDATLEKMLDANLRSAFYLVRAALPCLRAQGSGRIVAIGSRTAVEPAAGLGAYSASKAALVSLMRTVALENKDRGITANVVLPGTMDTPANRAASPGADYSRWVDPAQVAALVVHLASDEAAHVSGAAVPVLGGEL
jgi:NAD(P)-dependent dehydrogenase (short-subunit alcohol dehydrogenase family)